MVTKDIVGVDKLCVNLMKQVNPAQLCKSILKTILTPWIPVVIKAMYNNLTSYVIILNDNK